MARSYTKLLVYVFKLFGKQWSYGVWPSCLVQYLMAKMLPGTNIGFVKIFKMCIKYIGTLLNPPGLPRWIVNGLTD